MGERIIAATKDMTRMEHNRALARFEALAETFLDEIAEGATYTYSINLKAKGKGGKIPRALGNLVNGSEFIIVGLIGEIRRRDELLRDAAEILRGLDHGSREDFAEKIADFLGGVVG